MKTEDLIQLGALGLIAYLAYQKFSSAKVPTPAGPGSSSIQPSIQTSDFGVSNPNDPGWSDNGGNIPADFGLQNVIDWATGA